MLTDWLDAAEQRERARTTSGVTKNARLQAADPSALPQRLYNAVPVCARQCLEEYVEQGWSCSDSNGGCFCSRYISQGFTLGELAYICVQQECGESTHGDAVAAYQICSAYGSAVTATHSTLTVPPKTSTTAKPTSTRAGGGHMSAPSSVSQTSQSFATRTSAPATTASVSVSESAMPAATLSTASTTTSASAEAAGARTGSQHPTSLSTAEAIGISVACMGGVMLAICVFYLIVCLRRRKMKVRDEKQERDSYDFVDEAPLRFSPFHFGYADSRGPLGGFYGQHAELTSEKTNSQWNQDYFLPEPNAQFQKGLNYSPKSMQSRSTISQLLPDKPKATPPQLRMKPPPRPASNHTTATVFEEDKSPQMFSAMFPPPSGLPANPKAFHYPKVAKPEQARFVDQLTHSPASMRQPSLSIEIPKQASRMVQNPTQTHTNGSPLRLRSPAQRERRVSDANSSRSAGSFLNYYASQEADTLRSPESPTPIDDNAQTRRAVPTAITVTKPTYPPRAVRVTSCASDTSFESTDPDEPTPPEEDDKQLTPVKEHSPIAGIKYPKVPRSSNQSIPRSPPVGMKTSPMVGGNAFQSPKQMRRPNALPVGAHAKSSPRQTQGQTRGATAQQPRPSSQIPRKPVPAYQPPVTPERQVRTANNNSNLSGSTLAAKRRGDTAAHDLEQRLHITNSSHSLRSGTDNTKPLPPPAKRGSPHTSPLKGYGASRNNSPVITRPPEPAQRRLPVKSAGYRQPAPTPRETQVEPPLKSPLWEPKLTPSRKGEDLYLQVGVATPRTEGFGGGAGRGWSGEVRGGGM